MADEMTTVFIFQRGVANGEYEEVSCQKVFNSFGLASREIGAHLRIAEIHATDAPNQWKRRYDENLDATVMEYSTGYCGYVTYRIICAFIHGKY